MDMSRLLSGRGTACGQHAVWRGRRAHRRPSGGRRRNGISRTLALGSAGDLTCPVPPPAGRRAVRGDDRRPDQRHLDGHRDRRGARHGAGRRCLGDRRPLLAARRQRRHRRERRYEIRNRYAFGGKRLSGRTRVELTATSDLRSFSLDFLLERLEGDRRRRTSRLRPHRRRARAADHAGRAAGRRHRAHRRGDVRRPPGVVLLRGREQLAGLPARGRHHERAAHGAVVVPEQRPPARQGDRRREDPRAQRARGDLQRRAQAAARVGKRSTTWHWRADEPMVPYLAFFAAGDFTIARGVHQGLPWLVAVSQGLSAADEEASMRLMKKTPKVVAGLEKDLGDYPFSVVGRPDHLARRRLRAGEPDPADLSRGRQQLHQPRRPRARPPVVRRRRRRAAVARHLAQRGLRDLHGVALVRAARRPLGARILDDYYENVGRGVGLLDGRSSPTPAPRRSSTPRSTAAAR